MISPSDRLHQADRRSCDRRPLGSNTALPCREVVGELASATHARYTELGGRIELLPRPIHFKFASLRGPIAAGVIHIARLVACVPRGVLRLKLTGFSLVIRFAARVLTRLRIKSYG